MPGIEDLTTLPFSSLFVGIGLVIPGSTQILQPGYSFQFPFRRDWPCDLPLMPALLYVTFTVFQFPFRRDWPCDGKTDANEYPQRAFQFPFRRDWPCDASDGAGLTYT